MSEQPTKEQKATQLSRLREWMESAHGKAYGKNDKRRFARLEFEGTVVTMTPGEAIDWINDADDDGTYVLSEIWMTQGQYDKLPEFEGF